MLSSATPSFAANGAADSFGIGAMLNGKTEGNGEIAHQSTDGAACLVIIEKELGDTAVLVVADAGGEAHVHRCEIEQS
jgi:hypothetical protein